MQCNNQSCAVGWGDVGLKHLGDLLKHLHDLHDGWKGGDEILLATIQSESQRFHALFLTSGSFWYLTMFMGFWLMSMIAAWTLGLENPLASSGLDMTLLMTSSGLRPSSSNWGGGESCSNVCLSWYQYWHIFAINTISGEPIMTEGLTCWLTLLWLKSIPFIISIIWGDIMFCE